MKGPALNSDGPTKRTKMSCIVCTVLRIGNGWVAECGTNRQGPYLSKAIAFHVAAAEAHRLRRENRKVKISLRNENGEIESEYCLCGKFKIDVFELVLKPS
jgi:hypothetical protein